MNKGILAVLIATALLIVAWVVFNPREESQVTKLPNEVTTQTESESETKNSSDIQKADLEIEKELDKMEELDNQELSDETLQ
jgi:hypothetical protein